MIEQILEDSWPEGWIPSSSEQADFGAASRGLLRMDNLTLDEKGSIRLINRPTIQSGTLGYQVNSIFAAYIGSKKLRYLYDNAGALHRNYGALNTLTNYDLAIATGGTSLKAGFLNALGHVIALAGTLQYKDRGDIQWPLQIPQPAAPTLTNQAASVVSLANLDGSGNYTNWSSVASGTFVNTGTNVHFTPPTTNVAIVQTVFGSLVDTTNFGTTGEDSPNDPFLFTITIDDPTQLNWFKIELICTDPTSGAITDEYWAELDYANFATNTDPNNPYIPASPFTLTPGNSFQVNLARSNFQRVGIDATLSMATIKAVRFSVGFFGSATFTFTNPFVQSGAITGGINSYVCVELNDTGQFLQYSVASNAASSNASLTHIKVDRSGAACNAQCNNIRFYRNNTTLGQYIEVNRQTGAYAFTPTLFIDSLSDDAALAAAAVDNSKVLNFFRTNLPTNIIGAIWFAARVVYLTTNSFFPSFQLDLGSYDSRFNYELLSTNSEICLFICKLSVGTFIVATTVDFYQITGTFSLVSTTNPDGTTTNTQDVNILPLGISDPAINSSFFEVEGNIFYMSARGLRSMSNGSSTLLNTSTDLLFRNEARFGFPAVSLLPNDQSLIGMVASGTRLYIGLPFSNGQNATLVSTYNPPNPSDLRGSNYWRPMTMAALCMCKELDGTVIYGDQGSFVGSLEDAFTGTLPVDFLTQYNYGQNPSQTKVAGSQSLFINTGGNNLTLNIRGIKEDGTIITFTETINSNGLKLVYIDPHSTLINCLAYQTEIFGNTDTFELNYLITITVEEFPALTFYAIVPFTNFDKTTAKQLAKWGFLADSLGASLSVKVTSDNTDLGTQSISPTEPQGIVTSFWDNIAHTIGLDWQIEVIAPNGMHFFKFLPPDIIQEYPTITFYQIVPFTNFEKTTAKQLNKWGFKVDSLGNSISVKVTADNADLGTQIINPTEPEGIITVFWNNLNHVIALDWQIEVTCAAGMRFYGFLPPDIVQEYPTISYYQIVPFSNLGKDTLKKLAKWGFVIDTLGNEVTVKVTADNKLVSSVLDESPEPQGISTEFWFNNEDLAALDWQIELIALNGMRFYRFMAPDILQVYPPGRLFDQIGPLDLDREGIVFAMRLRVINEGPTLHYSVQDNDVEAFAEDIATTSGVDSTYEETFPKGINTSVLRVLLSSPTIFYRFSMEFKIRLTGKETEDKWVKL